MIKTPCRMILIAINRDLLGQKSGERNILPMSKINFRRKVEEGIFPQPIKLAKNLYLWRVKDIKELVARINRGEV